MVNLMSALTAVAKPTGVWEKIIFWFNAGISNYAWAIICLTLLIKVILSPLDFFNKKVTRKNSKMQSIIQPQIEILKKKYKDPKVLNQKTMELYKKHNYNVAGSCVFIFVNLAVTLFIFITLFSGLNKMGAYKITDQYEQLQMAYANVETIEEFDTAVAAEGFNTAAAAERVNAKYDEVKESWLWIDNVWLPDSPFKDAIPSFKDYSNTAKLNLAQKTDEEKAIYEAAEAKYNMVMNPLKETHTGKNGYLILVVIVAALSVVQQLLTNVRLRFKKKNKLDNETDVKPNASNKAMMIILPLLMGFFAFQYNAVFALYLVVSSLFSVLITPPTNSILDIMEKREEERKRAAEAVTYRRK